MKRLRYEWILVGLVVFTVFSSCKHSETPTNAAVLNLKRIAVPSRVFSIAGEALAFEALGDANRTGEASVSLRKLETPFGKFERVFVYEYNKEGNVLSRQELKVDPNSAIAIKATAGNRYLLFPDLGARFRDTYVVACKLGNARLLGQIVPRVCTQILCTDEPFQASHLKERIPELKSQTGLADLGGGLIGGFGREGSICDQCLGQSESGGGNFVPAAGCAERVPNDVEPPSNPETIVFRHREFISNVDWTEQIYKVKSDGSEMVNLSNNDNSESSPDVNLNSKRIVFFSGGQQSGITIMDLEGNNRTLIPDTFLGSNPKWSRNAESFIIYTDRPSNPNNSLHRVRPDGSENVEVVRADTDRVIRTADVVDDFHVIYCQTKIVDGGLESDIFIKDMREDGPGVNLTNTPDINEEFPVVSHNGSLIAYRAHSTKDYQGYEIRVMRLTLPSTLTLVRTIPWSTPDGVLFRDPEFSNDDTRFYVAANIVVPQGSFGRLQLFSISAEGSGPFRVTVNEGSDIEPSVVPR
jgi:hypothetical protein